MVKHTSWVKKDGNGVISFFKRVALYAPVGAKLTPSLKSKDTR